MASPDIEKVIDGLKRIGAGLESDAEWYGDKDYTEDATIIRDAITLLKSKEPTEPQDHDPVIYGHRYTCGQCHHKIWRNNNYCPNCGRMVKWK